MAPLCAGDARARRAACPPSIGIRARQADVFAQICQNIPRRARGAPRGCSDVPHAFFSAQSHEWYELLPESSRFLRVRALKERFTLVLKLEQRP